VLRTVAMLE